MASIYSGHIHFLNTQKFEILKVVDPFTQDTDYFVCTSFDPPSSSAIGANPYSNIQGYDITDLLEKNVGNSAQNLMDNIAQRQRETKPIERQYSSDFSWTFFKAIY